MCGLEKTEVTRAWSPITVFMRSKLKLELYSFNKVNGKSMKCMLIFF